MFREHHSDTFRVQDRHLTCVLRCFGGDGTLSNEVRHENMAMVNSYRFLARAGVALLLLTAVAAVGVQASNLRLPSAHPTRVVAAQSLRWRPRQVQVLPAAPGGSSSTLRVLIVGASVSHGLGASAPSHDYASDLARMLQRQTGRSVELTVWSRPGARIAASDGWSLPPGQRIVIVQLITNDFIGATPLLVYQQQLSALIDRVRDTSPHASLLCLGAWEPAYAVNRVGIPVVAYNSIERQSCAAHGGSYLSPSPIFQHTAWRGPAGRVTAFGRGDNFHPNHQGHLHLAEAILAQLRKEHALPAGGGTPTTTLAGKHSTAPASRVPTVGLVPSRGH
jgi:lysophospholipase L1-like esterase